MNTAAVPPRSRQDASEPSPAYAGVGETGTEALRAVRVTPNPAVEAIVRRMWPPLAPWQAVLAAIHVERAARLWGRMPDVPAGWVTGWFGDPHADLRAELAQYTPDDAEVTLAGIRSLVAR